MAHLITKKRVGEAVAIILTIWLALLVCFVGYSVFFPVWVYGIFSASQSNGPGFFLYGLGAPFRDYPGGAWIATILLCLVALVAHSYTRSRLTRNAGRIFFGSVVVGIATVALTYYFCGPLYSRAVNAQRQVNDRRDLFALVHDFGDSAGKPQVPDVAYFLYVDSARVRDMYSQIEPEWLEKQRIVTHSHTRTAKASVTGGAVAAEVGGSADAQEQSTEEPPAASPERECQGLMKYAVDRKGAKSYTTDDAWGITQILPELSKPTFQVPPETKFSNGLPLNWAEIRQLTASEPIFDNSPDATRAINEELSQSSANWESRLKGELTQPPDLIFVHGAFRISTTGSLLLSHDFVLQDGAIHLYKANFGPVLFSVTFPPGTHDREFDGKHEVNATVFGKVVHGLDDQGVIELRALAVY